MKVSELINLLQKHCHFDDDVVTLEYDYVGAKRVAVTRVDVEQFTKHNRLVDNADLVPETTAVVIR